MYAEAADGLADFVTVNAGAAFAGTVTVDGVDVNGVLPGGVPVAVAVFEVVPRSTSACVSVYEAVNVVDAPAASDATEDGETALICPEPVKAVSLMFTFESVVAPVFVALNE